MRDEIERAIGAAAKGGWNWFDSIKDPDIRERMRLELDKSEDKRLQIVSAWSRFAASPDGAVALEALWDATIGRTVWFSQLGTPMDQVAMFGAFREGQNALAAEIFRQVDRGRESEGRQLQNRETDNAPPDPPPPGIDKPPRKRAPRSTRRRR